MDTLLIEGCTKPLNIFKSNCELVPSFTPQQDSNTKIRNSDFVDDLLIIHSNDIGTNLPASSYSRVNPDEKIDPVSDFSDDCLKFISEILMEEDLDDQTASFCDYTALQATEKSLYDALAEVSPSSSDEYPSFLGQNIGTSDDNSHRNYMISASDSMDSELISDEEALFHWSKEGKCLIDQANPGRETKNEEGNGPPRGRKNLTRDDIDYEEERKSKHLATYTEEHVEMEQYDDVLLCKEDEGESGNSKGSKKKINRANKKKDHEGEVVDLMNLLTQCAQAVGSFDLRNTNELLKKLRFHSSQYGDNAHRVAHYFANALEARLAGTGWQQCRNYSSQRIPFAKVLKAYREQVSAIPFRRASYFVANDAIAKLTWKATKIHIIDFGIFFGFQWPGLIQKLSKRPIGPPMLRITGIDYPENGFRPSQRVEETGERLAGYCKRFNVPFEYQAIAKSWEGITLEELNIERDEVLIVNCLYMSRKLVDETVEENNPRDSFLRLIRKMNPDLFIHGIVNATLNSPFFVTRFKEALFHYSCVFDMFEATLPRESEERMLVENHVYGRDALNVIACEGGERVERAENYRQWQVRVERAGFRKLPLGYEIVKRVKDHVKENHHKDFIVDEDGYWMFQGWKGRILYALSCWTPT